MFRRVFSCEMQCVFKANSKLRSLAKKEGPGAEEFAKMASSVDEFTSCLLDPLKSNMEARHVFGDSLDDLMDAGIDRKQKTVSRFAGHVEQINRTYKLLKTHLNSNYPLAEPQRAGGARAEPHALENLVIHRSQKFWLSRDCPYVRPSVRTSVRQVPYLERE